MAEVLKEFALANITRVEIETEEAEPKNYRLTDVASEAEATATISEGEEDLLRVKNVIKAVNKTEDLVRGYDIRLVYATMIPEILALVDGGEITYADETNEVVQSYEAPPVGVVVERVPFTTHIYAEQKDADGSTLSYVKFSYRNCKGTPVDYTLQDGEFYVPEFNIESRSKINESPVKVEFLEELPA